MSSPSLSVTFDASLWDEPTTGIGLYTRQLCAALGEEGVMTVRVGAQSSGEFPRGRTGRTAFALGPLAPLIEALPPPLFHALGNFNLPWVRPAGKKLVLTVHDLIPELFPDTVSRAFRWQFRLWLGRSLELADQVICVSQKTREDLLSRHELDPRKVAVVYNGVDHVQRVAACDHTADEYLAALALPERFVLYAGSLDARKNVRLLLDAVELLAARKKRVPIVLAGQSWYGAGPVEGRVARMKAAGHELRPLGYLSEEVFYELMRRSSIFVFPSLYEGFGLPPLEAMGLGVPAIVSNAGSLPEVCADGALQIDPQDPGALAEAVLSLWESPTKARALGEAGRKRASEFTWARTARQTRELYERLL